MDIQPDNQTSAAMPTLCRAGCGFYGSSATENLCSKCFKDALKRKQDPNRQNIGASIFPASSSLNLATDDKDSSTIQPLSETSKVVTVPVDTTGNLPQAALDVAATVDCLIDGAVSHAATCRNNLLPSNNNDAQQSMSVTTDIHANNKNNHQTPNVAIPSENVVVETPTASQATQATISQASAKPRNRCDRCKKKVGFTGFECRCGGLFCGEHRYSDMHNCHFDYKSLGAQEIQRSNPVIAKEKIQKL